MELLGTASSASIVVEGSIQGARAADSDEAAVIRYRCSHPTELIPEAAYVAEGVSELQSRFNSLTEPRDSSGHKKLSCSDTSNHAFLETSPFSTSDSTNSSPALYDDRTGTRRYLDN